MGTPVFFAHAQAAEAWQGEILPAQGDTGTVQGDMSASQSDIRTAQGYASASQNDILPRKATKLSLGPCNTRSMSPPNRTGPVPNPRYARTKHKQLARQRWLGFPSGMTEQGR